MQRKLVIACTVTGLILCVGLVIIAFASSPSPVSVQVLDKRLKIYDVRFFPGTNVNCSFIPLRLQPKHQCQRVLDALGLALPWKRFYPTTVQGGGPALVIRGEIDGDPSRLDLVKEDVISIGNIPIRSEIRSVVSPAPHDFVWKRPLLFLGDFGQIVSVTNGVFHMRKIGERSDLAVIRIR